MTDENGWKGIVTVARDKGMHFWETQHLLQIARNMKPGQRAKFVRCNGDAFDFEVDRRENGRGLCFREFPEETALPQEGESVTVSSPAAAEVKPDITLAEAFVVAANIHRHLALSPSLEGNNRRLAHFACAVAIRKLELDAREMEAKP